MSRIAQRVFFAVLASAAVACFWAFVTLVQEWFAS